MYLVDRLLRPLAVRNGDGPYREWPAKYIKRRIARFLQAILCIELVVFFDGKIWFFIFTSFFVLSTRDFPRSTCKLVMYRTIFNERQHTNSENESERESVCVDIRRRISRARFFSPFFLLVIFRNVVQPISNYSCNLVALAW